MSYPKIASLALATGCVILSMALLACVDVGPGPMDLSDHDGGGSLPQPREVRSVVIEPDSITLSVGETAIIQVIVTLDDGTVLGTRPVSFWSSDTAVATVSYGDFGPGPKAEVVGRSIGRASITAGDLSGKSDRVKVIVN